MVFVSDVVICVVDCVILTDVVISEVVIIIIVIADIMTGFVVVSHIVFWIDVVVLMRDWRRHCFRRRYQH